MTQAGGPLPVSAEVKAAYRHCRALNAEHGRTFFLATALLPQHKRPAVHALYGFARFADDLVDRPAVGDPPGERLRRLRHELADALDGRRARHPVVIAVVDAVHRYQLDPAYLDDFLDSMASDLEVSRYATFPDLERYMWGSAAVIGLLMVPVLGTVEDANPETVTRAAVELGVAFQLTNFIRDVGEDYRRGRIYLPQDTLHAFDVTEGMLGAAAAGPELRAAIAFEISRARDFYRRAATGIDLLAPDARDCVRVAHRLYGEILDVIEAADHDVLARRARVGVIRRATVGVSGYARAVRARH